MTHRHALPLIASPSPRDMPAFRHAPRGLSPRIAALVAGLALAGASVHAQAPPPGGTQAQRGASAHAANDSDALRQRANAANQQADAAFLRADLDSDGRLSRSEADHLPAIAARFEQVDANRDQYISRGEFNRVLAD